MPNKLKVTRKLRAILSADVKEYSRLMADDEVHTIQTLKAYRQIMSDLINQHSGRVVDNPGDNLLAEFSSSVDAVEAALLIQNRLNKENAKFVPDKRLEFRIGVNIGDVVQDGDRIYGSGVNVAARIEGIANPGGICISRNTYDQVKDKLDLGFNYIGEHEVKNIKEPVRVYKVLMDIDAKKPLVEEELELPDKPSIAVLPFTNMSGDPSQEYFSDGLTEQIINGLCKVSKLFVIARNSSFAYKGKAVSVKQIAKELGVQYILEGSVQRAGDRVRITAQLIDATTDFHMWSDNYDRDLEDIFALQDEITMKLIISLRAKLIRGDQEYVYASDIRNVKAFDMLSRGMEYYFHLNKQDNAKARMLFKQALAIDDKSAIVYVFIGFTYLLDVVHNWCESKVETFIQAESYAQKALELNDTIDATYRLLSIINLFKRDYDAAVRDAKKSIDLCPNGADAHALYGLILISIGRPEDGLRFIEKAFRLNPIPDAWFYEYRGLALLNIGQLEDAVVALERSVELEPNALGATLLLAECYARQGEQDKAENIAKRVLEIDPSFSVKHIEDVIPTKDTQALARHLNALRKAGLPD